MKKTAGQDVDVANEETFTLLKRGQKVGTPLGKGRIVDIEIQAARYGDRVELEPPVVTVELSEPDEEGLPSRVVVCMCKLELGNKEHEALLSKEFSRLWPPITDDIPDETRMLVDVSQEFAKELAEFKNHLGSIRKLVARGEDIASLQREAYRRYVKVAGNLHTTSYNVKTADLSPGSVVDQIGGQELGESSVVLLQVPASETTVKVLLYLPETNSLKFVEVQKDSVSQAYDTEPVGLVPTVYDPESQGESIPDIRTLPDSYLPPDPNYPSSITNTVWRPTRRMTPIRYYNVKKGGAPASLERELDPGLRQPWWPPRDTVNYPVPDTVPKFPESGTEYQTGIGVYEYDPERRCPNAYPLIDDTPELKAAALSFWRNYQLAREHRIPGQPANLNLDAAQYAILFAAENGLDLDSIRTLLLYMAQKGFFTQSVPDRFMSLLESDISQFRTQFTNDA